MNKILIIAASSDLSKTYIESISSSNSIIDIIIRDKSKFSDSMLSRFDQIFEFNLENIDTLFNFETDSKYNQIIFFQGIDIIKPFKLYNSKDILKTFNINIISIIAILNVLISNQNILNQASILIISSISGITKGSSGHVLYSSSKAAILGLVKSLSIELAKKQIRINCISPGLIKTKKLFNKNDKILSKEDMSNYSEKYPLGIGEVNCLNGAIDFLLNDSSKWITGQNFIVDGGISNS